MGQPESTDELEVGLDQWRICAENDQNQDGKELIGTGWGAFRGWEVNLAGENGKTTGTTFPEGVENIFGTSHKAIPKGEIGCEKWNKANNL